MIVKIYKCQFKNFFILSDYLKSLGYIWFVDQHALVSNKTYDSRKIIYFLIYSDNDIVFTLNLNMVNFEGEIINYDRVIKFKQLKD